MPNILTRDSDKRMCIVTEWMHKGSLWDIIHDPSVQLSWHQVAKICKDIAAGLFLFPSIIKKNAV
jgi:hypothetical protein